QTSVEVHVMQGEREMAGDNRTLGRFHLDGIPPAPRGIPQIEVTFDIDANGIVHVLAKDKATGKEQKITITASSGLEKNDIDRLVKEAKSHEADDKKRREEIDLRNQADSLVYNTEKVLKENRAKVPEEDAKKIEGACEACRKAIEEKDSGRIKRTMEELTQASHKMAEAMYKATSTEAGPQAAAGGTAEEPKKEEKKDEKVVDAEFEETKE
ncbi:MAG: Hsp70 family protein, partial [Proteobacteria bacterium]|nr:Hsp70 family protein [Pseudomonadota bacterium]